MDDPNITIEEYIRLEEEKAQMHGQTFNWQTAAFGKVKYCEDEDYCFTNFEIEFPAIVFDDTSTSDAILSCEPTVSPLNENKIDFRISFDESEDEDYMNACIGSPLSLIIVIEIRAYWLSPYVVSPCNLYTAYWLTSYAVSTPKSEMVRIRNLCTDPVLFADMAPLPPRDQRNPWLMYQVEGYTKDIVHNYGKRLEMIFGRSVNRVHVLDFARLTEGMRQTLAGKLRMVYTRDEGQELFTSHAWRILFEIRGPLVREFILEFLSTCMISDTEMGLDVVDTLCFQLGRARRRMTWRQFILALGIHTSEEMAEDGFEEYWLGSERVIIDKGDLRDYWIEISGQAPKKVTGIDLFYLRSMDQGTVNVPYLLAQYLFRHAKGKKSGAKVFGGYFIGRLTAHFGLVSDEGLRGLSVITHELPMIDLHELVRLNICVRLGDTWAWVAPRPERQQVAAVGAPKAAEDAPVDDEGTLAVPAPVRVAQPPPAARTVSQRLAKLEEDVHGIKVSLGEQREVVDAMSETSSDLPCGQPERRRVRQRTEGASTSAALLDED
ncbi:hypothetical protein Tco_0524840 [Tanacetum coccineum]